MSELSKTLCELAGIEAKYYFKASAGDYVKGTKYAYEHQSKDDKWKVIYPNFETPENFVKLLECLFQFPFDCQEKETYIKSILCGTIKKLENEECGELKQLLKTTEFIY